MGISRGNPGGNTIIYHTEVTRRRGEGWRVDDEEGGGEGTPFANRLGDHTGRHFAGGVALQVPTQGSSGGKEYQEDE